jgi:hypothetical protein
LQYASRSSILNVENWIKIVIVGVDVIVLVCAPVLESLEC